MQIILVSEVIDYTKLKTEESFISGITDKIVNAKRLLCRGALIPLKWENFKWFC